jgi:predicted ATPase
MDLFYESLEVEIKMKKRVHFNAFMQQVHGEEHKINKLKVS